MNTLETKYEEEAMGVALSWHLREMPEGVTNVEIYNELDNILAHDTKCKVFAEFEDWLSSDVAESIWNLKSSIIGAMVRCAE